MARILIVGGHGKVALLLAPLLVSRGDEVTAVIRNPAHAAEVRITGADPVAFDVEHEDRPALARLVTGHDAVVWSAGAGGGDPARTHAVDFEAAVRSMDAAKDAGTRRYVMVSYFGSTPEHGVPATDSFHAYAEAKAAADEYLRATALDWTVLGPSRLTAGEGTGRIDVEPPVSGEVSRANVAQVVAQTLIEPATIHRTIRFNDGERPIAEALAGH
ncbi:NAD-dependent epimerase/dehydratase family protein [Microbacterium bovistercoris]|uniref:NAD-dependent epimerase/dehydratase family protein n=1 Tax=Microbacterium bovistercoris TaxID=2293570 RepID=A0A371NR17_9MICO|nr:NAD(P)H-binding protein [Microbacterium bovistercoris]REJ04187.1 NAD-dependent epimerase/dehydratase family protein [Microbacterium bovistercoris]